MVDVRAEGITRIREWASGQGLNSFQVIGFMYDLNRHKDTFLPENPNDRRSDAEKLAELDSRRPLIQEMARRYRSDGSVINDMARDASGSLRGPLTNAIRSGQFDAQDLREYINRGQTEASLRTQIETATRPARAPAQAPATAPPAQAAPAQRQTPAPTQTRPTPRPVAETPVRQAPANTDTPAPAQTAPVVAASPATTTPAPAAGEEAVSPMTNQDLLAALPAIVDGIRQKFPGLEPEADGFQRTITSDPALQTRIVANLNNNPEFMDQLMTVMASNDSDQNSLMQRYGADTVRDLLRNPSKLADNNYVDGLSRQLGMASGGMSGFLQQAMEMIQQFFGGGDINLMSMLNGDHRGGGSLVDRVVDGLGNYMRERQFGQDFSESGQFGRFGMTRVDSESGRPLLPEFRMQQADGTYTTVNADGTAIRPPEQPTVRPIATPPNPAANNDTPQPSGTNMSPGPGLLGTQ